MNASRTETPVVVVTGARKGLGRYLCEHYLGQGWRVVGFSRESSDLAHGSYIHVLGDVANENAVKVLFREVKSTHGRLDALINNAGIASMNHALLTPAATIERLMHTNYVGAFLCAREAARLMQRRGQGRIVNFSTVAVPLRLAGEAAYAASKAAVETLTRVLAKEFGAHGITVNAVAPTPIETDLIRAVPPEKIKALVAQQAIARMGKPEDVANVTDFFLSPRSSFITGQVVYLGGL